MLVERCWLCLEQPAVTYVELDDGRHYPLCDVCASQQKVTDDELRSLLGDS